MKRDYRWMVVAVAVLAVIAAVFAFGWMTLNTAQSKTGGWVAAVALLGVGIASAVSYYVLASKDGSSPRRPFWTTGKGVATLVSGALAGLGAMSLLFPLLDPPVATKDVVEAEGEKTRAEIRERVPAEADRRIVTSMPGYWGEKGCRVVYRFRIEQGAVLVDLVAKEPGMSDYSMGASIIPGGASGQMHATVERSSEPDEDRDSLVFTYITTGAAERLTWLNRDDNDVAGLELDRCGPGE